MMKPTKWSVAANNGAAATIIHIDEGAVVTVTDPGKAVFDIQLMCSEFAIVQDRWYTLTFEARAKRPRRIGYHISMVHPPWNGMGFGGTVDVGTEWKEYEAEFQARTGDEKTGVFFPIGGSLTGLEVRNVQLVERLEADPRAKIWQLSASRHSRARMEFPKDDPQAMRMEIERKGRSQWNIIATINGGPVKIYKKYALRFRAKADEDDRPIGFLVTQSYDPFNNLGLYEDIELTNEWEEQRFEFSSTGNDENVRIAFLVGDSTVPVELADVRIEPLDVRVAEGPLPPPSRARAWMLIAAFWAVVGLILFIKRRRVREWFEDIQQGQAEAARRREASQESRSRRRSLSRRT